MKKLYESPKFEVLKCEMLEDVILASKESSITSEIGGGGSDTPIDLGDDW